MIPSGELQAFTSRCLQDSGFLGRNILGWNYDELNGQRVNIGSGGVRKDGNYQKVISILDSPSRYKHIESPRGSLKSTKLQCRVVRELLRRPNSRVLYGMKGDEKAREKSIAIRGAFELPKLVEYFGPQRGEDSKWEETSFTLATRTQTNLQEPSFSTFSLKSIPTGGHYDLIIVDDLIDHENCRTKEAIKYAREIVPMLYPLLTAGGTMIFVGTRYSDEDIYNDLLNNKLFYPPYGETLILGAGVRVIDSPDGGKDLELEEGGLTFPHLTMDVLRERLFGMIRKGDYSRFVMQYLNYVPSGITTTFCRHYFKPVEWRREFSQYTGYLLTDTATSLKKEGCFSVCAYVLVDQLDNLYLADLEVGHWTPQDMLDHFYSMLERWQTQVNHQGECWEEIAMTQMFDVLLKMDRRSFRIRTNPIKFPRRQDSHKDVRIRKLEPVMRSGQFHVITDRVPKTFTDLDGEKVLFDSEGHRDGKSGMVMPAGELVDEFLRFEQPSQKVDIADAIAMVIEQDKNGVRPCRYRTPSQRQRELAGSFTRLPEGIRIQHDYDECGQDYLDRIASAS